MAELCWWLNNQLEQLSTVEYPFDLGRLPENGIYFFYEKGEVWGHGENRPRIVRIGTHREGNFQSRIAEHFLPNEAKMKFDVTRPPPHDRSIFRKHIGRALLNRDHDPYLAVWNIDLMTKEALNTHAHLRDIDKERRIETEVTRILRQQFSFGFIALEGQAERIGSEGLEARLIGTVARCDACKASNAWLGYHSPIEKVRQSGLWLVQHLKADPLTENDRARVLASIAATSQRLWGPG